MTSGRAGDGWSVAIVGAGIGGLATAASLRRIGVTKSGGPLHPSRSINPDFAIARPRGR